jgi:Tfp pilus assembly protein PilO
MKAKQFFFVTLGVLCALVAGGGTGYFYASGLVKARTDTLRHRLASQTVADDEISSLANMKKTYEKLQPLIPSIEAALPRSKQQSEIALQLRSLAGSSGLSLPSINFTASAGPAPTSQTVKGPSGVLALPISFQLTGTYSQLQSFLRSLENLNRYTGVTSLSISRKDEKLKTLSFSLTINVYIKP